MLQHDKRVAQPSVVSALPLPDGRQPFTEAAGVGDESLHADQPQAFSYTSTKVVPLEFDRLREEAILRDEAGEQGSEAFRMLRTQVLFWLAEHDGSSLAITSPGAEDGTSDTAINLALHIANEVDYTVLLVDANLRSPGITRKLGIEATRGLSDHLLEGVPLQDLLLNPGVGRLVVLPAGRAQANSAELLGSRAMARLVMELKARYPRRIILFDLPGVHESSDVLSFSRHVDGILMVVEEGRSSRAALAQAEAVLPHQKLVGVAMTQVRGQGPAKAAARRAAPRRAGWLRRLLSR
jgi:Mrp family chromosome partitioning ATPase